MSIRSPRLPHARVRAFTCASVEGAADRQSRIRGWDQERLARAHVLCVGAGGLGGDAAEGLVKIGVGRLTLCDGDRFTADNLNRQFLRPEQIGRNKALAVAANIAAFGGLGTQIRAIPHFYRTAKELGHLDERPDLVLSLVDNTETRRELTADFSGVAPIVTAGLDWDAEHGQVFVQEPRGPCWACANPEIAAAKPSDGPVSCAASCKDLIKLSAGWTLYAVESLLMDRRRTWNRLWFFLASGETLTSWVERRSRCSWCSTRSEVRS